MPTTYRSILLHQPTDGQIVFMRRFTRDPPVVAQWRSATTDFAVPGTVTITSTGSTYSGTFAAIYGTNINASGFNGWYNLTAGIYVRALQITAGNWQLALTDFSTWAWFSANTPWSGGTLTLPTPNVVGSPPYTQPTSITLTGAIPTPLIVPASLVQAWRPQ